MITSEMLMENIMILCYLYARLSYHENLTYVLFSVEFVLTGTKTEIIMTNVLACLECDPKFKATTRKKQIKEKKKTPVKTKTRFHWCLVFHGEETQ